MDEITKKYINELDEIKAILRITDKQLAQEIGVTPAMLSNWRRGKASISALCQNRIIQFYMRIDWKEVERLSPGLFLSTEQPNTAPPADDLLDYVVKSWQTFTPAERGEIVATIENIKERKNAAADLEAVKAE